MRKIPTLYQRDPMNPRYVMNVLHPDCQWVIDGEGKATYKWDGTAVRIDEHGVMWKRREIKSGKPIPKDFRQEGDIDPVTGKCVGWVRAEPTDKWHFEGLGNLIREQSSWPNREAAGTYELIGPKVQGNPHQSDRHVLIRHGWPELHGVPTGFDDLGRWLHNIQDPVFNALGVLANGFEGVVWHHPDGRMAKIKKRDFPSGS